MSQTIRSANELARPNRELVRQMQATIDRIADVVKAGKEEIARNEANDKRHYVLISKDKEQS